MKKNFIKIFIILLTIVIIPFPAYADFGSIQIDGFYDDWEDKPHTEVYPGNNPLASKINYVSLFRDESNVYVHVIFAYKNNQGIKNMIINLYTNLGDGNYYIVQDQEFNTEEGSGTDSVEQNLYTDSEHETYYVEADNVNNTDTESGAETAGGTDNTDTESGAETAGGTDNTDNGQGSGTDSADETSTTGTDIDTDLTEHTAQGTAADPSIETDSIEQDFSLDLKKPGQNGTWAFTVWDELFSVGSGYFTKTEGEPDELELYIPLSSITNQYEGITEISMIIKKLGKQSVACVGADTKPFVGAAIGAGIAVLSAGAYTYKKKKPYMATKGR